MGNQFFSGLNAKLIFFIILLIIGGTIYLVQPRSLVPIMNIYWENQVQQVGVGSPRLADINSDGIKDILIGSGFEWAEKGESAMNAIDGKTGDLIWRKVVPESAYGTPFLIDINQDGIKDTTVSGRFSDFYMLDGKTGDMIWKLSEVNPEVSFLPCNFNSPTPVADMDNDGYQDFVVIQGGLANNTDEIKIYDHETNDLLIKNYNKFEIQRVLKSLSNQRQAEAFPIRVCLSGNCEVKTITRDEILYYSYDVLMTKVLLNQEGPGGRVYVISSRTGNIIRMLPVPNQRESWSVPIYLKHANSHRIIYGSGGERKDGYFQSQDIETGQVHWSVFSENKGVISSPLLIYENGRPIVVGNTMNGELMTMDALTGDVIWKASVGDVYETYSSVAMIKFENKSYHDVVSVFSRGVWPKYESATLFIFDGKTGEVIFRKKTGFCNGASSPVIADVDGDYLDDIVLITCTDRQPRLLVINNQKKEIFSEVLSSGAYATPIVSDLDQNGQLDIIISRFHFLNRYTLLKKQTPPRKNPWNQYRGSSWTGVFN